MFHISCLAAAALLLTLSCSSCAFVNRLMDRGKGFYVHQVKWEGGTLSVLSKWYTGTMDNWSLSPQSTLTGSQQNRHWIEIRDSGRFVVTRTAMPKKLSVRVHGPGNKGSNRRRRRDECSDRKPPDISSGLPGKAPNESEKKAVRLTRFGRRKSRFRRFLHRLLLSKSGSHTGSCRSGEKAAGPEKRRRPIP